MPSTDNEDDPSFLALPARLRYRIDDAFDSMVSGAQSPQSKFGGPAGGFIVEEPEYEAASGGFIIEDLPSSSSGTRSYIPLSEIPRALRLLGVFPDDDIIGVFNSAATGWGALNAQNDGVSRKDWRAVCAALLEGEEEEEGSDKEDPNADEDTEMGIDNGEYQQEELSDETEEISSDEYEEPSRTGSRASKVQKVSRETPVKGSGSEWQLSKTQKAQCRQDFRRFFPHVSDDELDHQRIMIKDVTRVADLLKENLKAEEILEMVEAFSTSPDKSMNLADFERMMILAKLV